MARIEVVMPQMGESIAEGTIVKWHKQVGEAVKKDETLLEISTDKVDSEIPSPASGTLAEIVVKEQTTVPVQTVIAYLESGDAAPAAVETQPEVQAPAAGTVTASPAGEKARFYSPLVLSIARTEGVSMGELEQVQGTGDGGRVTKKDLLAYIRTPKGHAEPAAPPAVPVPRSVPPAGPEQIELRKKYPAAGYDLIPMSNVQQKMAQHMVHSIQTSPHVAAIHEVDMTVVARHRTDHAAAFEQKEGFKLTFTPYIIDAVVKALKKFPMVNSSVDGATIVRKQFINIGLAVASENGLIVPVIKHAEEKNFLGIARAVRDLAERTRNRKLMPDDIQGGTFTISNYGVFGTMFGTPIINQPQVAILGTGAITRRVAVREEALAIRSMAYFTLSFDHRAVDGMLAGMFMDLIVKNLEGFDPGIKMG